jgi:hypothetical protein
VRRRGKHRAEDPARSLATWRLVDRVGVAVFIVLIGVVVAFLVSVQFRSQPSTYEGRIVDKSITLSETYQGSGKVLRLHVRGRDGEVSAVKVTYDTYERARVGMWVRSEGGGVELSWDEPTHVVGATKTEGAETPSVSAPR